MSTFSATSLDIELAPSRRLAWVLVLSHIGALLCVLIAAVPIVAKLIVPWPVLASLVYCVKRYAQLKQPDSPKRLLLSRDRQRIEFNSDDRNANIELLPGTVNSRQWVMLRVQLSRNRRLAVPLTPDMMNQTQWRRLRVWLTVQSDPDAQGQARK